MKTKILCLVLLVCVIVHPISSQIYSPVDSISLLAIDDICDASDSLNWNTEPDPGKWEGVTWNGENPQRVSELRVIEKSLTGAMDVSDLTNLTILDIQSNQLTLLDVSVTVKLIYQNLPKEPA